MCGPKFCSMNISQDINESVKTINIKNIETEMKRNPRNLKNLVLILRIGMQEMYMYF